MEDILRQLGPVCHRAAVPEPQKYVGYCPFRFFLMIIVLPAFGIHGELFREYSSPTLQSHYAKLWDVWRSSNSRACRVSGVRIMV